jgi:hypothetical protein
MSAYYIVEPPEAATPASDYSTVYGNISTYLNQIKTELSQIDTDTTASTATLALIAVSLSTLAANSTTMATNTTTIAANTTTIAEKQTTIAEKQTTIAEKQTAMETYQKKLKELGEGRGIHVIGPYEWMSLLSIYRLFVEQGKILDAQENASPADQAAALQKLKSYVENGVFNDIPTSF